MNGILLIDKPKGWTSHDVVAKVRTILRRRMLSASHLGAVQGSKEELASRTNGTMSERETPADVAMHQKPAGVSGSAGQQGTAMRRLKVGHTGTLDPMATGLLILVLGDYTKRAQQFSGLDKTYETEVMLGSTSTTADAEGEIAPKTIYQPSKKEVDKVLHGFLGEIEQIPPAFSAIKVDGQRAYKLARAGKEVVIKPRKVKIHSITAITYDYPTLRFKTEVSSGTYIRSLAEDVGGKLGTGAYLSALRRVQVGRYDIKDALQLDKLDYGSIKSHLHK